MPPTARTLATGPCTGAVAGGEGVLHQEACSGACGWSVTGTTIASWVLRATTISTGSVSLAFCSQWTIPGGMKTKSPARA